ETPIYAEYEDSTRRQIEENGVITAWAKKDGKNISQQIQKDGKTYYVEYDGNGNTKGVVVQNGESPAVIAKKFGVSLEDLMQVNADKLKGKGNNRYFLVGEDILIPGEMDAEKFTKINSRRDTKAQAIGKYTAWVEAERAKKEDEAKAKAGNKDVEAQPRTGKCKHSKYKDYSYKVDPKTGKVSFFDKTGKQVDEKTRQAIINAEGEKAAAYLRKGAKGAGTNDKLIDAGIDCIYSKEIQFSANKWLATKKYGNYSHKNKKETNIEYLLRCEYSRSEKTDKVVRIMQNGGYGNQTETNIAAIRYGSNEIKEINDAYFYKSENIVNLTEKIVTNRDIRIGIEKELGNKSIEQFWLDNDHKNVVAQKISIKQVSTNAYEKGTDQMIRNKIVKKGMESFDTEVVEATLTAVDPTYKEDYDNLTNVCKDINEQRKYKKQFNNQNDVQIFIDNYTASWDFTKNDIKINVKKIDQYNHNLYQFNGEYFEIPADIKAESFALSAKHDKDYSRIFTDTQDPEVFAAMQKLMDNNEISGIKDFNALYNASNHNDPLIRANAILSGKVDGFEDEDIVNTAIALMHSIDSDNGEAKSGTTNKGYASVLADKKTLVLEQLILNNPHLKGEIKTRIEKEKFEEKYSKNQDAQTNNFEMHSEDTKYKYLAMLNNSYSYADIKNAKIYDDHGMEITDPAKKQQYINANKESLENLRAYIRQVERGFKEQLGTEGDYSTMADYLSRGLGLGTNREDVYNQYRKAKDMLANLDKAAEGRLLDKNGKPVSFEKYAELCNVEIEKISEAQQKYTTTNSMFKTGIVLAPIVVVTTVATGGSNVLLVAGASGTATYLIEEGLNTWERKTSLTGDTTERALSESTDALIDGTIDAITAGMYKCCVKLLGKLRFLKPKHVTIPKSKTPVLDKAVHSKPSVNAEPKLQPSSSVRVGNEKAVKIKAEVHENVKGTTSGEELANLDNKVNSLNSRSVRRPMQNEISEKVDALPEPEQRAFIDTKHKNLDSRIQDKLNNNRILNQSDARDIRTLLKQEEDIDYLKKLKDQISNNKIKHNS
ncbi:LysM peptidoglycan-binding domain-containing protein, partial [bacterium]|nr:LysM peptidoglycan-binding domain-containing protein [bacterium]